MHGMNKLSLHCDCGQEMIVPESALGKAGLCPGCGAQVPISEENTRPHQPPRRREHGGGLLSLRKQREAKQATSHREEAWRNFAAAVDLYNARKYAEALTLLNNLIQQFPGNPHIETARDQCLDALQRIAFSPHNYDGLPVDDAVLSPELVKSVVLEKMLHGGTEDVQLRAAELAARLLGVFEHAPAPPEAMLAPEPAPEAAEALEYLPEAPPAMPDPPGQALEEAASTPNGRASGRVFSFTIERLEAGPAPVFIRARYSHHLWKGGAARPARASRMLPPLIALESKKVLMGAWLKYISPPGFLSLKADHIPGPAQPCGSGLYK